MIVNYVKPTVELVEEIARNMRQADIDEVWASSNCTPLEALMSSWEISEYTTVLTVNDEACVMLGLVVRDILSGHGIPWVLGTDNSLKHKKGFFTEAPEIINQMLNVCPRLHNYVHSKNRLSIRWLKWAGFTICEPEPYGCEKELFHKFYIERV